MAGVYGNVNVNYSYCKSVAQLKSAADDILGTKKEQIKEGIQKTRPEWYGAFGCNRDNQKRMGYDESKMKSMKYKMTVYDKFLKEYEYRKKHCGAKENVQKKQKDRE